MRTLILGILFLLVVPLASGSLKPEQESEHWKDSGMDRAFAERLISDELCHQDLRYYDSCRRAIHAGALLTGKGAQFKNVREARYPQRLQFGALLGQVLAGASEALPEPMLLGRMITAQLQVFDKYAQIIPTSFLSLLFNGETKTYYDIGIESEITAAGLFVYHVHPNTPASFAGLRVHDRIVSVNGILARTFEEARFVANMWPGKRDQRLLMEIEREGRILHFEITTAPVSIDDFQASEVAAGGKIYGYLRLLRFGQGSCSQIEARLERYRELGDQVGGVILDLRHNAGGMVSEGQCIAQLFLGDLPIIARAPVDIEFPNALNFPMGTLPDLTRTFGARNAHKSLPLTVLVDAASKSMSEVVAGALQGFDRAWVIGERTYGKSAIQHSRQLPGNPKLRLLRTVARFQLPDAIARAEAGIAPDFEIPYLRFASHERRTFAREVNGTLPAPARQGRVALQSCLKRASPLPGGRHVVESHFGYSDEQLAFALAVLSCGET